MAAPREGRLGVGGGGVGWGAGAQARAAAGYGFVWNRPVVIPAQATVYLPGTSVYSRQRSVGLFKWPASASMEACVVSN